MGDPSILTNIIAAIHSIRAEYISIDTSEVRNESDEVDIIQNLLLTVESHSEEFENFEIVKRLKCILSGLLRSDVPLSHLIDEYDDNISVDDMARKVVFDSIRKETYNEIRQAISGIENDNGALLQTSYANIAGHKKKKNDGYFSSFNFDDLPEYESLEVTLKLLRADHCSDAAVGKILAMDLDELAEHPQWRELILLLRYSLYNGTESCTITSLQLHLKFANFLPDYQAIDAVINILNYFIDTWITLKPRDKKVQLDVSPAQEVSDEDSSRRYEGNVPTLSSLSSCQLSIFTALLFTVSERVVVPSMEGEGDRAIASIFLLFAHATVPVQYMSVDSSSSELTEVEQQLPLMDALALFTVEKGDFVRNIARRRHPSAVLTHAVHSGLMGVLNHRLALAVVAFNKLEAEETLAGSSSQATQTSLKVATRYRHLTQRTIFYAKLLLSLLDPFLSNAPLMAVCSKLIPPSTAWPSSLTQLSDAPDQFDSSEYLWNSSFVPRENVRFKEAWSTDVLQSVGNKSISMEGCTPVNKLVTQLSGAKSLLEFFTTRSLKNFETRVVSQETQFSRMFLMVSKNMQSYRQHLLLNSQSKKKNETGITGVQERTHQASDMVECSDDVASLGQLMELLTSYSLCCALPSSSSTTSSSFSTCSSSCSSSQENVLLECTMFCVDESHTKGDADVDIAEKSSFYLLSFLRQLELCFVSAMSQQSCSDASRKSVVQAVLKCLVTVTDMSQRKCNSNLIDGNKNGHENGHNTSDGVRDTLSDPQGMSPVLLCRVAKIWTAVLDALVAHSGLYHTDSDGKNLELSNLIVLSEQSLVCVIRESLTHFGFDGKTGVIEINRRKCPNRLKEVILRSHRDYASTNSFADSSCADRPSSHSSTINFDNSINDFTNNGNNSNNNENSSSNNGNSSNNNGNSSNSNGNSSTNYVESTYPHPSYHSILQLFVSVLRSHDSRIENSKIANNSNLMQLLVNQNYLSNMVTAIIQSVLASCLEKLSHKDIDRTSLLAFNDTLGHSKKNQDKKSVRADLEFEVPSFQDVLPLIDVLFSDISGISDALIASLFSVENITQMRFILRKFEVSPYYNDCSLSIIQDDSRESAVTPLMFLLSKLIRSNRRYAADRVLSLCAESWESVGTLYRAIQPLLQSTAENSLTDSPSPFLVNCTAQFLAYVCVYGELCGLEFESIGGPFLQILYNALQDDDVCEKSRTYILTLRGLLREPPSSSAEEEGGDLSQYFTAPITIGDADDALMGGERGGTRTKAGTETGTGPLSGVGAARVGAVGMHSIMVDGCTASEGGGEGGWSLMTLFVAAVRCKLSDPSGSPPSSLINLPFSLLPSDDAELQLLISSLAPSQGK